MKPREKESFENYLIKERVKIDLKKYGTIENTIKILKSELESYYNLPSIYCTGGYEHAIICTRLKINYLQEVKQEIENL
jgi:hypothetical protein